MGVLPMNSLEPAALALSLVIAAAATGCAPDRDATTRRLDELQTEITRLKASNIALQERLEGVEALSSEPAAVRGNRMGMGEGLLDDDRPELAVVTMTPEPSNAEPPMPPDSEEERPSIVGDRHRVEQIRAEAKPGEFRR
jgi:hypothetical protein